MSEQPASASRRSTLFALATGVALFVLLVEWLVVARLGLQLDQGEVSRSLLGLALGALATGIGSGMVAVLSARWLDSRAVAIATPVSALLLLELYLSLGSQTTPVAKLLAAVGSALVLFALLVLLLRKVPAWVAEAGNWWALAALMVLLIFLLLAGIAVDSTGAWLAVAAAAVAGAVLLQWRRAGGVMWPFAAVAVMLLVAAVLATRVPVWHPVNNFAKGKPSVLLVTIDTLRADHVGAYGYADGRTPVFDALARQGVLFRQTVTANVYTGPSHASILSGLLPVHHGVLVNKMLLPSSVPTLADILNDEGYVTGAFVSGYTTRDRACGLPSRFQMYDDDIRAFRWFPEAAKDIGVIDLATRLFRIFGHYTGSFGQAYRMGEDTADVAVDWLARNSGQPFFVWTHFFDPHLPYRPPQAYRTGTEHGVNGKWYTLPARPRLELVASEDKLAAMIDLYDAEVAYADAQLGRVVEAARAAAPDGNLLIVVTSDHGESMGEHGIYWARQLYDPTLLVPLVVVPPDTTELPPTVINSQVRLIDVAPTILDILSVDSGTTFDGSSLLDLMATGGGNSTGPAFSSTYANSTEFSRDRHAIRHQGWKLIRSLPGWEGSGASSLGSEELELYELSNDAGELQNLVNTGMEIEGVLLRDLQETIGQGVAPDLNLTHEERERLRSLGYIQ